MTVGEAARTHRGKLRFGLSKRCTGTAAAHAGHGDAARRTCELTIDRGKCALRRGYIAIDTAHFGLQSLQTVADRSASADQFGILRFEGETALFGSFQLDLAIFSAPGEPFGLRLIEPVAEGVPVIAYETGAGSDEIARNCAGIATVPYEQAEAMAELAAELLDDPGRRARMAQAGQRDIERSFSIASMAAGVDAVYSEILASKGGKSH